MRKYLMPALFGVLVASHVYASPRGFAPYDPNLMAAERDARTRGGGNDGPGTPSVWFLNPEGDGRPVAQTTVSFCDAAAAAGAFATGDTKWWCANGGIGPLNHPGSHVTFTTHGAPSIVTASLCPNGPNCEGKDYMRMVGGDWFESTTSETLPNGDFTMCAAARRYGIIALGLTPYLVYGNYALFPGGIAAALGCQGGCGGAVTDSLGNALATGDQTPGRGTDYMYCLRYDNTAKELCASSGGQGFGNCQTTPGFTSPQQLSTPITLNTDNAQNVFGTQMFDGAFLSASKMTDAQVMALSNARYPRVVKDITNSRVLNFDRTSLSSCCRADGQLCNGLMPGVPCINADGLSAYNTGVSNQLIYSYALDQPPWTATATLTGGQMSPFQWEDGWELNDGSGAASQGVQQTISNPGQTGTYPMAASCWFKAGTLTEARLKITGIGDSTGDVTCTLTGLDSTWNRRGCTSPTAYLGTITGATLDVLVGSADADTGTVLVSDCQLEGSGAWQIGVNAPSPYVETEFEPTFKANENVSFKRPSGVTDKVGCAGITTYTPLYGSEHSANGGVMGWPSNTANFTGLYYNAGQFGTFGSDYFGNFVYSPQYASSGIGFGVIQSVEWDKATSAFTSWNDAGGETNLTNYGGKMFNSGTVQVTAFGNVVNAFVRDIKMNKDPTQCRGRE